MRKLLLLILIGPMSGIAQCPEWLGKSTDSARALLYTTEKFLKIKFKEYEPPDKETMQANLVYEPVAAEPTAGRQWMNSRYQIDFKSEKDKKGRAKAIYPLQTASILIEGPKQNMTFLLKHLVNSLKNCNRYLDNQEKNLVRFGNSLLSYSSVGGRDEDNLQIKIYPDPDSSRSIDHEFLAINQRLNYPSDLAIDSSGNIFFTDTKNERVCKIDKETGKLITIAGAGTYGFSGDDGPAVDAQLNHPTGIAVSKTGDIFIGDAGNGRVRKVDMTTGIITTLKLSNPQAMYGGESWHLELLNDDELYILGSGPMLQKIDLHKSIVTTFYNVISADCFTINRKTKKIIIAMENGIFEIDPTQTKEIQNDKKMPLVEVSLSKIVDGSKKENVMDGGKNYFEKIIYMTTDEKGTIYFCKEPDASRSVHFFNNEDRTIQVKNNPTDNVFRVKLRTNALLADRSANFYTVDGFSVIRKIDFEKQVTSVIAGTTQPGAGFEVNERYRGTKAGK